MRHEAKCFVLAVGVMLMVASAAGQQFQLMEASINEIHRGLQSGKLTCHSLVQQYLDRIKAYDQQGPTLNAMLYVNPKVLEQADAMDKQLKRGTKLKPLQCIPVVLKDNFDTADMPTTGASLALKGMQPTKDAFTVARFRQNGALILGKTNMHELALFRVRWEARLKIPMSCRGPRAVLPAAPGRPWRPTSRPWALARTR